MYSCLSWSIKKVQEYPVADWGTRNKSFTEEKSAMSMVMMSLLRITAMILNVTCGSNWGIQRGKITAVCLMTT